MTTIVYKVTIGGHSTNAQGKYRLSYKQGETTLPAKGTKWLLACQDKDAALAFARFLEAVDGDNRVDVWECEATVLDSEDMNISALIFEETIDDFWKGRLPASRLSEPIAGSAFCSQIKPIRKVCR